MEKFKKYRLLGVKMNKYIFTFGSGQLTEFNVRPNDVALIIEANNENEARSIVFDYDGIGDKFCTSYPYSYIDQFKNEYNMKEYSLDELESRRKM